ncbi:MAG: hypothetical protein A3C47_03860 [Omnitrophica bacterium RIFCSPHIGHO2_02_FULL_51_18]|nr:MAG: hypothetical protein A3C47_03860 [Omnitrophica bacterium RIFCSPHIGHO2_02_FULL_51_18]
MVRSTSEAGLTLAELLISIGLLSVVALGASTVYISGARNLVSGQANIGLVESYTALDHIARKVANANLVEVGDGGPQANDTVSAQLKLRWDYKLDGTPNTTAGGQPIGTMDTGDDTWVKYIFIDGSGERRLYWTKGAAGPGGESGNSAGAADDEVGPTLRLDPAQTSFTQVNSNTIRIQLAAKAGSPTRTVILKRNVTAHASAS